MHQARPQGSKGMVEPAGWDLRVKSDSGGLETEELYPWQLLACGPGECCTLRVALILSVGILLTV